MMCARDTLPGPAVITTRTPASIMRSIAYPPLPVRFDASLTTNIAPSIIIASNDAAILLMTPIISNMPEISSARAIGICISTGMPKFPNMPANPGLNFPDPCTMNTVPIAALIPQLVMSFIFDWWILASVNVTILFLPYKIFYPIFF